MKRTKTGPYAARKAVNSSRIERWLGPEKTAKLVRDMAGWYGPPINIRDVPGSVWIDGEGHFSGDFQRGHMVNAYDALEGYLKRLWNASKTPQFATLHAGFSSISDALARASAGHGQRLHGAITKVGPTGVVSAAGSLWRVGTMPVAGSAGAAAPGGTAHTSADTGALIFNNPSSGTLHLTGADFSSTVINNSLLLYDRLFSVAKTINSTATEAVTGVPTRYQSTTSTAADYAGGNFLFMEVGATDYANTAHNWNVCKYTDQSGNTGVNLPSLAGNPGAVATIADRLDMPMARWFAPLASGDTGIKALTQMQCSAAVATGDLNFVIGHPIAIMAFPVTNSTLPFDWLTNREQAPRIFDDACLAFLEMPKPATNATVYCGQLYACSAA